MTAAVRSCRGFSFIELLVAIGVVMVLMGLALPALSKSRVEAERSRQLKQIQQCATLVALYSNDWTDAFPLASADQFSACTEWYKPVIDAGFVGSIREIDPTSIDRGLEHAFYMSASMSSASNYYRPDAPPYPWWHERPAMVVRSADVVFPSSKGELWTWRVGYTKQENLDVMWCCRESARVAAPVAFADGSAASVIWQDLVGAELARFKEEAGQPVISTWHGVSGRDR